MGIQGLQTSDESVGVSEATYLTLLKEAITASLYPESSWMVIRKEHRKGIASFAITSFLKRSILEILSSQNFVLVKKRPFDPKVRGNGEDWPMFGYSMIGHRRLDNIEYCIRSALSSGVEGDFVECGVWRGGASIYARSVLNLLGAQDRTVWLADSFEGFPVQKQEDKLDPPLAGVSQMIVQLDEVRENFARFGLLGDNVKFLKGWFSDTLPGAPIKKIAVLRLDGDYYSSTMDSLNGLYDRVAPMGYVIVDDFNCFKTCERAVEDFCSSRGIKPNFIQIEGGEGVYWQKLEH